MKNLLFKPDYIMIPFPVYSDDRLEGMDRVIYGIIYYFEAMRDGKCYASNAQLARIAGENTNIRSISNCLDRLEKCGYIDRFYKDDQKRNRTEIRTNINFKKLDKPTARWNSRDSSLDDTNDSSLDEQSINNIKLKKKITKKHNPARSAEEEKLIADTIDLFKDVNPTHKTMFGMPLQRDSTHRLLQQYGFEALSKMIKYLPVTNAWTKYPAPPVITTPNQLERKMGELKAWGDKQKNKAQNGTGKGMASTTPEPDIDHDGQE